MVDHFLCDDDGWVDNIDNNLTHPGKIAPLNSKNDPGVDPCTNCTGTDTNEKLKITPSWNDSSNNPKDNKHGLHSASNILQDQYTFVNDPSIQHGK